MQIKLDENNKILMYGGAIYEATADIKMDDENLAILTTYFSTYECYLREEIVVVPEEVIEEVFVDEETPPEYVTVTKNVEKKKYSVEVGNALDLTPSEEDILLQKREERKKLLTAFDKWEKAVLRGRETDSEETMNWYYSLLDLADEAFIEIPERVQYYL